jgi:hypothetical protein
MPSRMGRFRGRFSGMPAQELQRVFGAWVKLPKGFGGGKRIRLFPSSTTFWLFLSQIMDKDGSCRESLRRFQAWLFVDKGGVSSASTAGYCKARLKISSKELERINHDITMKMSKACPWLWHGRSVKVVDGTGLSMPDTPSNRTAWPLSRKSKPGCGFPVMRVVGIFSLATGALLDLAHGTLFVHERTLYRSLWGVLAGGDILLGDRGFCGFADFFFLSAKGVDCVMRKHVRRINAGVIRRLGKKDRIVEWKKTGIRPKWLDHKEWKGLPEKLAVREVEVTVHNPGFRSKTIFIVTTLLDPKEYPAEAIADLYLKRWKVELYLKDIKITMGMDILKCKTPDMIQTELWMKVIAHNLVRAVMMEAAIKSGVPLEGVSFKGTVYIIRYWASHLENPAINNKRRLTIFDAMLSYITADKVPKRPNRTEPRARKRRPKNFELLTKPRHLFHEISHRNRYKRPLS